MNLDYVQDRIEQLCRALEAPKLVRVVIQKRTPVNSLGFRQQHAEYMRRYRARRLAQGLTQKGESRKRKEWHCLNGLTPKQKAEHGRKISRECQRALRAQRKQQKPKKDRINMPRIKQGDLPAIEGEGVAPKRIKALEVAADNYVDRRDTRMKLTEEEVAARSKLAELMKQHNLTIYRFGDEQVEVKPGKDKVKVRKVDGTETEDEGD